MGQTNSSFPTNGAAPAYFPSTRDVDSPAGSASPTRNVFRIPSNGRPSPYDRYPNYNAVPERRSRILNNRRYITPVHLRRRFDNNGNGNTNTNTSTNTNNRSNNSSLVRTRELPGNRNNTEATLATMETLANRLINDNHPVRQNNPSISNNFAQRIEIPSTINGAQPRVHAVNSRSTATATRFRGPFTHTTSRTSTAPSWGPSFTTFTPRSDNLADYIGVENIPTSPIFLSYLSNTAAASARGVARRSGSSTPALSRESRRIRSRNIGPIRHRRFRDNGLNITATSTRGFLDNARMSTPSVGSLVSTGLCSTSSRILNRTSNVNMMNDSGVTALQGGSVHPRVHKTTAATSNRVHEANRNNVESGNISECTLNRALTFREPPVNIHNNSSATPKFINSESEAPRSESPAYISNTLTTSESEPESATVCTTASKSSPTSVTDSSPDSTETLACKETVTPPEECAATPTLSPPSTFTVSSTKSTSTDALINDITSTAMLSEESVVSSSVITPSSESPIQSENDNFSSSNDSSIETNETLSADSSQNRIESLMHSLFGKFSFNSRRPLQSRVFTDPADYRKQMKINDLIQQIIQKLKKFRSLERECTKEELQGLRKYIEVMMAMVPLINQYICHFREKDMLAALTSQLLIKINEKIEEQTRLEAVQQNECNINREETRE